MEISAEHISQANIGYTKGPSSITKCWPTDERLLQCVYKDNRYWWYCGYTQVLIPRGHINISLALVGIAGIASMNIAGIASEQSLNLTELREQPLNTSPDSSFFIITTSF